MSEKDFWEGYVPEPVKSGEGVSATVTITLPAQQEFVSPGGGYVPAIPAQQRPMAWPVQEPAQRTWEEWFKWWRTSKVADSTEAEIDFADFMLIVRAVEAEYGIKENT